MRGGHQNDKNVEEFEDLNGALKPKSDVYSFGMTCYEVITGLRPFDEYLRNDELQWALAKEERPELRLE